MTYIKFEDDKSLVVTVYDPIYRGENLTGNLIFLIPQTVEETDVTASAVYLSYIRADGVADIAELTKQDDLYDETYLQYTIPVTCRLTKYPGEVCAFITIYSGTPSDPTIIKSGETVILVQDSKNMDDYICDHQLTSIYALKKEVEEAVETVNTISSAEVVDGELIVTYTNGDVVSLGTVSSTGQVYVPSIDEQKILTWTIEDEAGEIPDPVDLYPYDEWTGITTTSRGSDFNWNTVV